MSYRHEQVAAIVNPSAGGGTAANRWKVFRERAEAALGTRIVDHVTERVGHATELTRRAIGAGHTLILSVGGDGTHNEVVNGFFDATGASLNDEATLGVLPLGTGCDLAKSLAIPIDPAAAIEALKGARRVRIDAGHITLTTHEGGTRGRYFINIGSCGVSGQVAVEMESTPRFMGPKVAFYIATVRGFLRYVNQPVSLWLDGKPVEVGPITLAVAANGKFFGGGMKMAPDAMLDDGLLDVVVIGDLGLPTFLRHGGKLYSGTHGSVEGITFYKARTVEIRPREAGQRVLVDLDGEQPGLLPATYSVCESALYALAGEGAALRGRGSGS